MGGGGGGDEAAPAAATPASTGGDSPAPAAAAAAAPAVVDTTPAAPDPVAPWVEAATTRRKIPFWAIPVLALLPIWAAVYMLTLDTPTPTELGAFEAGEEVYSTSCSSCHGATGGGSGANPALTGPEGAVVTFATPAAQVAWVALGSSGFQAAGFDTYGDGTPRPVTSGMPAWGDSLTPEALMEVVLHERSGLNDEEFDIELWTEGFEDTLSGYLPADKVAAYVAVLEEWEASPPEPAA
ncbi:MAG: c-type cytochrome [Microthrixaceae bacterium]